MTKPRKSPIQELDALIPARRASKSFIDKLPQASRDELTEVRTAWLNGRWKKLTLQQVSEWAVERYKLDVSPDTVRRWLMGRRRS